MCPTRFLRMPEFMAMWGLWVLFYTSDSMIITLSRNGISIFIKLLLDENVYATLNLQEKKYLLNSLGDGFMHRCDTLHIGLPIAKNVSYSIHWSIWELANKWIKKKKKVKMHRSRCDHNYGNRFSFCLTEGKYTWTSRSSRRLSAHNQNSDRLLSTLLLALFNIYF